MATATILYLPAILIITITPMPLQLSFSSRLSPICVSIIAMGHAEAMQELCSTYYPWSFKLGFDARYIREF
ncbi:hypothetical protein F5X96DRAFT_612697 [Biscogniauxia mediterranea]|nr:hypothetical protein F5X96DRAFT_612697 [Biscogniauxia mediterranea]